MHLERQGLTRIIQLGCIDLRSCMTNWNEIDVEVINSNNEDGVVDVV